MYDPYKNIWTKPVIYWCIYVKMVLRWSRQSNSTMETTVYTGFWVQFVYKHVFDENGCFYNYGPAGHKSGS